MNSTREKRVGGAGSRQVHELVWMVDLSDPLETRDKAADKAGLSGAERTLALSRGGETQLGDLHLEGIDLDGDGIDDRVLGHVPATTLDANGKPLIDGALPGAGVIALQRERNISDLAYVGDRRNNAVHALTLKPLPDYGDVTRRILERRTPLEPAVNADLNVADPVNPFNGELLVTETDMTLPGRGMSFSFTRTYRSQSLAGGPLGVGWDHSYNQHVDLTFADDGAIRYATVRDGSGRADAFPASSLGTFSHPPGIFSELTLETATRLKVRDASGTQSYYEQMLDFGVYRLVEKVDRYGNHEVLSYTAGKLTTVTDSMGRDITFEYTGALLTSITDWTGRSVHYEYNADGDLHYVRGPPTTEFPSGPATTYTYSNTFASVDADGQPLDSAHLNHNLLTITDPNGDVYLENTYSPTQNESDIDFDRVISQTQGCAGVGGNHSFSYAYTADGRMVATVTNRRGFSTTRTYDTEGHLVELTEHGLDLGDLVTTTAYTYDGLEQETVSPRGVRTVHTYASTSPDPTRRADITSTAVYGVNGDTLSTEFELGPFGRPTRVTVDGDDSETVFTLNDRGDPLTVTKRKLDGSTSVTEEFAYHPSGLLDYQVNPWGGRTTHAYYTAPDGGLGYLRSSTPPEGVEPTTYEYDDVGNITRIVDARGDETTTAVNPLNQVTSRTTWRGTESFTYDGNGNVTVAETTYNDGTSPTRTVSTAYDCLGHATTRTEQAGTLSRTVSFEYDEEENLHLQRSARGNETLFAYDARNKVVDVRTMSGPNEVVGVVRQLEYDADENQVTEVVDPLGVHATTTLTYDGLNRQTGSVDPNGNITSWTLNVRGEVVRSQRYSSSASLLKDVSTTRDNAGRVLSVTEKVLPDGTPHTVTTSYGNNNRLVTTTDTSMGRVSTSEVDTLGRVVREVDAAGNVSTYVYAGVDLDRMVQTSQQQGGPVTTVTEYDYTDHGRLQSVTVGAGSADARTTTYVHDARDNVLLEEHLGGVSISRSFDGFGRAHSVINGRDETHFTYDENDNVLRVEDALGHGVTRVYDGRDRLLSETYEDASQQTFTYRGDNLVETRTDRAGNLFDMTYDVGGRLQSVDATAQPDFEEGTASRAFTYDGLDQMLSAVSTGTFGAHRIDYTRDSRGNPLTRALDGRTLTSTYNPAGERVTLAFANDAGLNQTLIRDGLGRAQTLERTAGGASLVTYGFWGPDRIERATYANGTTSLRTFTGAREEQQRVFNAPGSGRVQTGFVYGRTTAGVVTGVARLHQGGRGDAYRYSAEQWVEQVARDVADPLAEDITTQVPTASEHLVYTHDDAGNWATRTRNGVLEDFVANDLNQYSTVGTSDFTYDDNGNLRDDGERHYVYDAFGELVRAEDAVSGDVLVEYEYDALAEVAVRRTQTDLEQYVHDGGRAVAVLDAAGEVRRQVVFMDAAADIPVLLRVADGGGGFDEYFYQRDGVGSVVALSDAAGAVVERYEYDAYGKPTIETAGGTELPESAVGNRLLFGSRPWDPLTGLTNLRARWYAASLGRFLTPDPAGLGDGTNLYAYAGNDPVNFVDPTGLARRGTQDNPGLARSTSGAESFYAFFRGVRKAYWEMVVAGATLGAAAFPLPNPVSGLAQWKMAQGLNQSVQQAFRSSDSAGGKLLAVVNVFNPMASVIDSASYASVAYQDDDWEGVGYHGVHLAKATVETALTVAAIFESVSSRLATGAAEGAGRGSVPKVDAAAGGEFEGPLRMVEQPLAPKGAIPGKGINPKPGTRVRPEGVPENWRIRGTDTPGGTQYYNPKNPNESVRVMQGNPNSPFPNSQAPYARQRNAGGTYYKQDGTLSSGRRGGKFDPDTHIPLDDFTVR